MKQIQLTYHEESGYLYPDLTLPEQTHHPIGKYIHEVVASLYTLILS